MSRKKPSCLNLNYNKGPDTGLVAVLPQLRAENLEFFFCDFYQMSFESLTQGQLFKDMGQKK